MAPQSLVWSHHTEANYDRYTAFGAQLGLYGQYINLLAGEDYFQLDYTGGFDLADSFFLGINATTASIAGDTGFAGVALYPQLTTSDSFAIGLRGEFFSETDGFGAFKGLSYCRLKFLPK